MSKKKVYDDDDGRTIAPMDDVHSASVFGGWLPSNMGDKLSRRSQKNSDDQDQQVSPQERRYYVLGALAAALLVGLAFIVGLGLIIALMYFLFR